MFPEYTTEQNVNMSNLLDSTNSVFIHARRGDMLSANGWCYKYGFFKRAVKYIKKNVEDPLFVFFTNTGSIDWCKKHAEDIFGLKKEDKVMFVDWNAGDQSFRDMQLMTHCKHGIITNSTFGWWGAYLIKNPKKITISPYHHQKNHRSPGSSDSPFLPVTYRLIKRLTALLSSVCRGSGILFLLYVLPYPLHSLSTFPQNFRLGNPPFVQNQSSDYKTQGQVVFF